MKDDGSEAHEIMNDPAASPSGWNKPNLVINENILDAPYSYTVVLQARYENAQAWSKNVLNVTTSSIPSGGYCAMNG